MSNLMDGFFAFGEGSKVTWEGEPAVVILRRAEQCTDGTCRSYLIVPYRSHKRYWVEPFEIGDDMGNEGLNEAAIEVGFQFAVGDLVRFRTPDTARDVGGFGRIHATFVIVNRQYESRQGVWQRAYALNTESARGMSEVALELAPTEEASEGHGDLEWAKDETPEA